MSFASFALYVCIFSSPNMWFFLPLPSNAMLMVQFDICVLESFYIFFHISSWFRFAVTTSIDFSNSVYVKYQMLFSLACCLILTHAQHALSIYINATSLTCNSTDLFTNHVLHNVLFVYTQTSSPAHLNGSRVILLTYCVGLLMLYWWN